MKAALLLLMLVYVIGHLVNAGMEVRELLRKPEDE